MKGKTPKGEKTRIGLHSQFICRLSSPLRADAASAMMDWLQMGCHRGDCDSGSVIRFWVGSSPIELGAKGRAPILGVRDKPS